MDSNARLVNDIAAGQQAAHLLSRRSYRPTWRRLTNRPAPPRSAFDAGDTDLLSTAILSHDNPAAALDVMLCEAHHSEVEAEGLCLYGGDDVHVSFYLDYARMVRLSCRLAAWHLGARQVATPHGRKAQARTADARSIKENTDLVSYIDQYVSLTKAGNVFKAPCPFHDDRTPSF